MKLFYLEANTTEGWPRYDSNWAFVIRAADDVRARVLASRQAGDEGEAAWLTAERTSCEELDPNGSEGVICRDFNAG